MIARALFAVLVLPGIFAAIVPWLIAAFDPWRGGGIGIGAALLFADEWASYSRSVPRWLPRA